MKELIKVEKKQIGNGEVNAVDARELHDFLEVKTHYSTWIARQIKKYEFAINSDFSILETVVVAGGDKRKDYIISIDMAKELSMVENNDKGRQARKFFIERDKKLTEIEGKKITLPNFNDPAEAAIAWAAEYKEKKKALEDLEEAQRTKTWIGDKKVATALVTASHLSRENNKLRPKAEMFEQFFEADNVYTLSTAFKLLDLNPYVYFRILKEKGFLFKLDNGNIPAESCRKKGYFKVKLVNRGRNGQNYVQTYVTHEGLTWMKELFCVEDDEFALVD